MTEERSYTTNSTAGTNPLTLYSVAHPEGGRTGLWCCLACGAWLVDSLDIEIHFGIMRGSLVYPGKMKQWPNVEIWREVEVRQGCPKDAGRNWLAFACKTPGHGWEEP